MIFLHTLLLAVALASSMQEMLAEYRLQLKAYALYERRAYKEAETIFRQLVTLVPEQQEKTAACFNLACSLYMQGKYPEAAALFSYSAKPAGREHREIQLKALYNEGNTLAMKAIGSSAKAEKTAFFRQSLNRFKKVLLAEPDDGDAKINYEIVRRYLYELETPKQSASSKSDSKSSLQPASGVSQEISDRLLENAQQNESSLMQQLSGRGKSASQENKNTQDW